MIELFSDDWAKSYMDVWNADEEITTALANVNFSSIVAFGFDGDETPSFCMTIEKGKIVSVGEKGYNDVDWDLRASKENWAGLIATPPGLMKLGLAYTSRKLKFLKGDYASMIKDPSLSGAFIKCFALMGKV